MSRVEFSSLKPKVSADIAIWLVGLPLHGYKSRMRKTAGFGKGALHAPQDGRLLFATGPLERENGSNLCCNRGVAPLVISTTGEPERVRALRRQGPRAFRSVDGVRLNPRELRSGHRRSCGSDLSADDRVLEERRDGSQHIHAAVM